MGTYYNQDFDTQGGLWGTLELFLSHTTDARTHELLAEIEDSLDHYTTEDELNALLDSFHCNVYMGDEPGGYRAWFEEIAVRVRRHLAEQ